MFLIAGLIGVVVATIAVTAWMLYSDKVESEKAQNDSVVPIADLSSFNKTPESITDSPLRDASPSGDVSQNPQHVSKGGISDTVVIDPSSFAPAQVSAETTPSPAVVSASPEPDNQHAEAIRILKEEVRLIREKAVIQAKNAIEVINKLRDQADQLRAENKNLVIENEHVTDSEQIIIRLEGEKKSLMEELKNKNSEVETLQIDMGKQSSASRQVLEHLQAENAELKKVSIDVDQERLQLSQDIRAEYQARLDNLILQIEAMRKEKESLLSVAGAPDIQSKEDLSSTDELASLNKAADVLREDRERLEAKIREAESRYSIQIEKNNFLQYELTKSRAQAMGIERIYENSRKQIEDLTRQISDARLDNKELQKQTDILGKSLNDFRRLNAELLKREKLTQFEIERNRGDLRDLERIYDGFRSRVEKVGMGEEANGK